MPHTSSHASSGAASHAASPGTSHAASHAASATGGAPAGNGEFAPYATTSWPRLVRTAHLLTGDLHEAVIMPGHLEGPGGVPEHLDLARPVGLHPRCIGGGWSPPEAQRARLAAQPDCNSPGADRQSARHRAAVTRLRVGVTT